MSEGIDAAGVVRWLETFADRVSQEAANLTRLDAAIGDADHGTNMERGFKAVRQKVLATAAGKPIDQLLKETGMTLLSTVGGAAGPLYGTFFLRMAAAAGPRPRLTSQELAEAFAAGVEGVRQRGKAEPDDKTMLDALAPARDSLKESGSATQAAAAAEEGCRQTIPLVARRGRASFLGERSAGHPDPGATSSALLVRALAEAVDA